MKIDRDIVNLSERDIAREVRVNGAAEHFSRKEASGGKSDDLTERMRARIRSPRSLDARGYARHGLYSFFQYLLHGQLSRLSLKPAKPSSEVLNAAPNSARCYTLARSGPSTNSILTTSAASPFRWPILMIRV